MDYYLIDKPLSLSDKRNEFTNMLLKEVLEKTISKYGPYKINFSDSYMEKERLFNEMIAGKYVNITAQATQAKWEDQLIPIRIPVDKGISNYQIFLIRKETQPFFNKIKTISDLKKVKLGVGSQWSSYSLYKENHFNVIPGINYDGLFSMLMTKRFDFFPRGINEIYLEYREKKKSFKNLAIEKTILIYFPMPKYFFVSKKEPGLARRLEIGLNMMISDGSFDKIVFNYHQNILVSSNLKNRKLFKIDNPFLSAETPLNRTELWFNPLLTIKD
jgi:hypothetical protein